MSAWALLIVAGATASLAKLIATLVGSRLDPGPRLDTVSAHLVAATTAAFGVPAVAHTGVDPTVAVVPLAVASFVAVVLAARGRSLGLVLEASLGSYLALGAVGA